MKLATIRVPAGTAAVRVDGDVAVDLGLPDVEEVLRRPDWESWAASASGPQYPTGDVFYAPLVTRPARIICAGLNYRAHIAETGAELPRFPVLFSKFASCLVGANDDIWLPPESDCMDWEAELAVVIGKRTRRVAVSSALGCVAGYAVFNDVSARDWQARTSQWLQGKTFDYTCPLGPWLVTADEFTLDASEVKCVVDDEIVQQSPLSDLLFGPAALVSYVSAFTTLEPGDIIATGTPGGVGGSRNPPVFLAPGQTVLTSIDGLGACKNTCRSEVTSIPVPGRAANDR